MEMIFEFFMQIVGEFLLQLLVEALAEAAYHVHAKPFRRSRKPIMTAIGYFLVGGAVGMITLLFFPTVMIEDQGFRIANLVVTPFFVGLAMSAAGAWRRRRGLVRLRIETFTYGALFAFGVALVRLIGTA